MNLCDSCKKFDGCKMAKPGRTFDVCWDHSPITRADLDAKNEELKRVQIRLYTLRSDLAEKARRRGEKSKRPRCVIRTPIAIGDKIRYIVREIEYRVETVGSIDWKTGNPWVSYWGNGFCGGYSVPLNDIVGHFPRENSIAGKGRSLKDAS